MKLCTWRGRKTLFSGAGARLFNIFCIEIISTLVAKMK